MTIKRCYSVLVGASVVENQLFDPTKNIRLLGLTITQPEAGRFVVNGTIESNTSGNVNIELKKNRVYYFTSGRSQADIVLSNTANWVMSKAQYVIKPTGDGTFKPNVYVAAGTYTDANFIPQIIDLTALLGSTIADYIYSLETATAGAGIAKLREWGFLTGEYTPYNAGTLESVEATAKVVRDENNENAVTYPLGSDVLRGIFKLDANNNLYADGDVKSADGTITRRYKKVTYDGSEAWMDYGSVSSNNLCFRIEPEGKVVGVQKSISDYGANINYAFAPDMPYKCYCDHGSFNMFYFRPPNDTITTSAAWKTYLASNPITVVYELATPTTETSTPFQSPQVCYPDGTEEFITESGVPVGHETKYQL